MKGSNFIFDSVQLLYYKCRKISFKRIGSHIESPNWIKNMKATINYINGDDKCFQYALIEKIGKKTLKEYRSRSFYPNIVFNLLYEK